MKNDELRKRAEEKLRSITTDTIDIKSIENDELIYELLTNRIELELQNDELLKSQDALIKSRSRYADLYNFSPIGYLTLDEKGVILESNKTCTHLFSVTKRELVKRPLSDFVLSEDQDKLYHLYKKLRTTKTNQSIELRINNQRGKQFWVKMECNVIIDNNEKLNKIRASLSDITSNKLTEEKLSEQKNLLQLILATTKDLIALKDINSVYQSVNPAFCGFVGKPEKEIINRKDEDIFDEKKASIFQSNDAEIIKHGTSYINDECISDSNGKKWLHIVKSPVIGDNENVTGILCTIHDISKRKYYENEIWRQANFDALTGLPNRSLFIDRCHQAIHSAHRDSARLALLFIDLDRFKWVNDNQGHEAGDKLLQETARRLMSCSRETDTVARLSGDEFTIILTDVNDLDSVQMFAEKILMKLARPYKLKGSEDCYISGSIGISFYPDDTDNMETLLKNADMAMYKAKQRGRNAIEYFTEDMTERAHRRIRMIHELREAVENIEFIVEYQPIIEMSSGEIFGAEALLRWQHPTQGLLMPDNFIAIAEETGAIIPIGKWALDHVTKQAIAWKNSGLNINHLSVNVSARQFRYKHFLSDLNKILNENNIPSGILNLDLEITESLMMNHAEENIEKLDKIKDNNVTLSLDDFGTGYSSLQQLKNFPIDTIKIDRSFIHNILTNKKDAKLTKSIINMAKDLDMNVIAEGIETAEQYNFLLSLGVNYGQGYFISPSLCNTEFSQYYFERKFVIKMKDLISSGKAD